jgi:hypothetical protein
MVKFMELLTPYEGTTYSDINDGCELTYQERLIDGQEEIDMLLDDGEDALRDYIIKNADFEYDDRYKLYGGMIVMSVNKETGDIEWYLRED